MFGRFVRAPRSACSGGARSIVRALHDDVDGSITLVFASGKQTTVDAATIQLNELRALANRPLGQVMFHGWVNSLSYRTDAIQIILASHDAPPAPERSSDPGGAMSS